MRMPTPLGRFGARARTLVMGVIATVLVAPVVVGLPLAQATTAPLAANRLVFDSNRTGNYEIFAMGFDGSNPVQLTSDPRYDSWWPRISPDRTQILFYRTPQGTHDRDFTTTSLWLMNADGSDAHQIIANGANGWVQQGHAMWSPDGRHLAMFAGSGQNPNIWVTDADGTSPHLVMHRAGTNVDPSWDPSGQRLLFIGCPLAACTGTTYEVYRVGLNGAGLVRLTSDLARDQDPVASPDGSRIAWLRQTTAPAWAVFVMNADGTGQHAATSGLQVNSKPAWSPDGQWVFFHCERTGQTSFGIWRMHPDGTDLQEIDGHPPLGPSPYANEYPDASLY